MKRKWTRIAALTVAMLALGVGSVLAQSAGAGVADSTALALTEEVGVVEGILSDIGAFITALVSFLIIVGLPLFVIVHMAIVLIKTRNLNKPVELATMVQRRIKRGMPEEALDEENELCEELLEQAYLCYSVVEETEDGGEMHYPKNMREVLRMQKMITAAGNVLPTDEDVLQRYNDYREALYTNMQRNFNGSSKLLWLGGLVTLALCFFMWPMAILFGLGTVAYHMASRVPQFMIEKKQARGGGSGWFTTLLVTAGLGALGSGYTVRTHYTDGTHSDDNSSYLIALVLGMCILFAVACTIFIWAGISYLRNYVFYI